MKRIATANRAIDLFGVGKDGFKAAVAGVSDATYLSQLWMNHVQEALVRTREAAGGAVPADGDYDWFVAALKVFPFTSPTATTPAQFDNSTKLATTAALVRQGMQAAAFTVITTSVTLTAAACGSTIACDSAGAIAPILPLAGACPAGTRIEFVVTNTGIATLTRQGGDTLKGTTSGSTSLLGPGDTLTLESNGSTQWIAVGGSGSLGGSASFGFSTSANGYQKLPSGIIVQWCAGANVSASGTQVVSFPTTFPNLNLRTLVTNLYASAAQNGGYGLISSTPSNATIARNNADNALGVTPVLLAVGY